MAKQKIPQEGSCRCGKVRFTISAPPLLTMACHCTGCQRMTASAYSLSAAIPTEGFKITQGEPVLGGRHGSPDHFFCDHCKSWVFTKMPGLDFFINVRSPMLDDQSGFEPFVETWTSEALPWAKTTAVHSYPTMPEPGIFEGLIKEYMAR